MSVSQSVRNAVVRVRRAPAALWHNRDGAAILEFALVAPAFIALLIAILNVMLVFLAQEGLETAAEGAARLLTTGEAQTTTLSNGDVGMSSSDFKNIICNGGTGTDSNGAAITYAQILPPMLSCSRLTVNVISAGSYNVSSTAAPTFTYNSNGVITSTGTGYTPQTGGLGQNQIVALQLIFMWPTTKSLLGFDLSTHIQNKNNSDRMLVATSVFTTENYNCGASQTSC